MYYTMRHSAIYVLSIVGVLISSPISSLPILRDDLLSSLEQIRMHRYEANHALCQAHTNDKGTLPRGAPVLLETPPGEIEELCTVARSYARQDPVDWEVLQKVTGCFIYEASNPDVAALADELLRLPFPDSITPIERSVADNCFIMATNQHTERAQEILLACVTAPVRPEACPYLRTKSGALIADIDKQAEYATYLFLAGALPHEAEPFMVRVLEVYPLDHPLRGYFLEYMEKARQIASGYDPFREPYVDYDPPAPPVSATPLEIPREPLSQKTIVNLWVRTSRVARENGAPLAPEVHELWMRAKNKALPWEDRLQACDELAHYPGVPVEINDWGKLARLCLLDEAQDVMRLLEEGRAWLTENPDHLFYYSVVELLTMRLTHSFPKYLPMPFAERKAVFEAIARPLLTHPEPDNPAYVELLIPLGKGLESIIGLSRTYSSAFGGNPLSEPEDGGFSPGEPLGDDAYASALQFFDKARTVTADLYARAQRGEDVCLDIAKIDALQREAESNAKRIEAILEQGAQ